MEAPETHAHHHDHSGHRWLDIAAAGCAIVVSVISLFLAIHHGQVMKEMADANARMVTATSWPRIQFSSSNLNAKGEPEVVLSVVNKGIGPARIEGVELRLGGKPLPHATDILKQCCDVNFQDPAPKLQTVTSSVNGEVLRPGEEVHFLRVPQAGTDEAFWARLDKERSRVSMAVCYCSVFDECWVSRSNVRKIEPVKACPANWMQMQG